MKRQQGFTLVEVVVVILVIGLLGFIGVRAWGSYTSNQLATKDTSATPTDTKINSSKDLDTVSKQLDNVDVVGSFESDLNNEASF